MIFVRKINKIPKFYMILPENARILRNSCPKKIFPDFFFGGGHVPPVHPVSYAYAHSYVSRLSRIVLADILRIYIQC